ncbi:MAG TPA: hypothetical protein VK550_07840 [Polyangiaceae bacterium]|nr:hypothetical protein [Polyangiaceae bacterium]
MRQTTWARGVSVVAIALAAATVSGSACAGGAVLAPSDVPVSARGQLEGAIAQARKDDSQSFEDLAALRRRLPELDAQKRGDVVTVALPLEDMGPRVLWPIVEELAFAAQPPSDLAPGAWRDWRVALIEALGLLHDARTEPVVLALLAKRDADAPLLRAAVEAAGRLGTRSAINKMVSLKPADASMRRAVWEGMGECHHMACVQALSAGLAAGPDTETAAVIARSLGRSASSWAWQTPALAATGEGRAVRAAAAKALINALPSAPSGAPRDALFRAIGVVEDRSTAQLARDLRKKADPELARDLDKLLDRLAASQARP